MRYSQWAEQVPRRRYRYRAYGTLPQWGNRWYGDTGTACDTLPQWVKQVIQRHMYIMRNFAIVDGTGHPERHRNSLRYFTAMGGTGDSETQVESMRSFATVGGTGDTETQLQHAILCYIGRNRWQGARTEHVILCHSERNRWYWDTCTACDTLPQWAEQVKKAGTERVILCHCGRKRRYWESDSACDTLPLWAEQAVRRHRYRYRMWYRYFATVGGSGDKEQWQSM
jgi:hypothetical protein